MPYERSCVREYARLWPATHGRTSPQQARGGGGGPRACSFDALKRSTSPVSPRARLGCTVAQPGQCPMRPGGPVRAVHGAVRPASGAGGPGHADDIRFLRARHFPFTIITLHTAHPIIHPVTNSLPERRLRRPLTRSLSCLRTCARTAAPRPSHSSWRRRAQRERAPVHSSCYSQRP